MTSFRFGFLLLTFKLSYFFLLLRFQEFQSIRASANLIWLAKCQASNRNILNEAPLSVSQRRGCWNVYLLFPFWMFSNESIIDDKQSQSILKWTICSIWEENTIECGKFDYLLLNIFDYLQTYFYGLRIFGIDLWMRSKGKIEWKDNDMILISLWDNNFIKPLK